MNDVNDPLLSWEHVSNRTCSFIRVSQSLTVKFVTYVTFG